MMIRPVLIYPHPTLAQKCAPITGFDDSLQTLATDLTDTMRSEDGCGLAASQIGVLKRVVVVDVSFKVPAEFLRVLVNPVITARSGKQRTSEGCLSVPGESEEVERFAHITLTAQTLTGELQTLAFEGFTAVAIQHELDHLDGVVFVDRLSPLKRRLIKQKLAKRKARQQVPQAASRPRV